MSKIIIFDGQVFQSAARQRGMGHYSFALLESLYKNKSFLFKKSYILLNKNLPIDKDLLTKLQTTAPQAIFIFEDLLVPQTPDDNNFKYLQTENEKKITAIVSSLKEKNASSKVIFVILALFIDQACVVFPKTDIKILLFYDLIPLQYFSYYSMASHFNNYLKRFKTLYESDLIWTISGTSLNDLKINLGISDNKLQNIWGASISRKNISTKKPHLPITDNFVLMPTGDDFRKNNLNAVKAFELFLNQNKIDDLQLVITSYFNKDVKDQLKKISKNIIFTDIINENELSYLYKKCKFILFISKYEGLGLPVLEAVDEKKPVVCTEIPSFLEMSNNAFYFCDPDNIENISEAIKNAYLKTNFDDKLKYYDEIINVFNWEHSTNEAINSLNNYVNNGVEKNKLNVAIFSPSPSSLATPGKFTLLEHSSMQNYFNIDYYLENGVLDYQFNRADPLTQCSNSYLANNFSSQDYKRYDAIIYHIGNSDFHVDTIHKALIFPGYVVFHDTYLTNIFSDTVNFISFSSIRVALEQSLNKPGANFLSSIANRQIGLITHSKYALEKISTVIKDNNIQITNVNLPTLPINNSGLDVNKKIKIIFAGIIHKTKGIDLVYEIIKNKSIKNYTIYIIGINFMSPEELIALKKCKNIVIKTNLSDFEFQTLLSQSDILVNYRNEYHGETSASVLESMRYGVVPIVRKIGWFDELPDDTVIKVDNKKEVLKVLEKLVNNKGYRELLSEKCRKYIEQNHSYDKYAKDLYDILSKKVTNKNSLIRDAIKNDLPIKKLKKLF